MSLTLITVTAGETAFLLHFLRSKAMITEYSTRVDDHRLPFGHQHRASGLSVAATVEWCDGMPYATVTEATGMPDGPALQSDIDAALQDIEAQAYADGEPKSGKIARLEKALGASKASHTNPCGAVVAVEPDGQWRISDDFYSELYATFEDALAAAETWGRD